MNLISHEFLLLFIPLTLTAYYWLTKTPRQKTFFLLGISYFFYSLAGWQFLPILFGLSLATYALAKWNRFGWGVALNLAALILFKYWNFGIDNLNFILSLSNIKLRLLNFGLPLGLSFFIFKHIGYLYDIQQKRYAPAADFWTFAAFSAYFPQISAGPISSYKDTASQFERLQNQLSGEQITSGLISISLGLAKKILIADTLSALLISPVNTTAGFSGLIPAWYLVIAYAAQLYFDFSGYTDLMLGISQLLGVRLPQNFNNPYLANNPAEFWERWHISLSNWFRIYVFAPLSRSFLRKWGSDKREQAQYAANIITMSLVGLWHGAGWNFILWGAYHGVLLNLGAIWKRANRPIHPALEKVVFLFFILIGWAIFMGQSAEYLAHLFTQLFGFGGLGARDLLLNLFKNNATLALIFAIPITFSGAAESANLEKRISGNKFSLIALGILAALCILSINDKVINPFIYIQF
jgi:D-alanyl-lipoteichoic acid acyltransferase DltB (MBOAT superfamily)